MESEDSADYFSFFSFSAIVIIEQIYRNQEKQPEKDRHGVGKETIWQVISRRIRAKLITAFRAILALSPFALGMGIGA